MNINLIKLKRSHLLLILIIILGLTIQLLYYLSIHQKVIMVSDSWTYLNGAKMMQKGFYIDVYRPPVYLLILLLFGTLMTWEKYYIGVILFQVFLSILDSILIYRISNIITNKKSIGLITALMVNLSMSIYGWNFMIMTESLSIFLVTLITFLAIKYFQSPEKAYSIPLIFTLIVAIFTKPFFLFLPILLVIIYLIKYFLIPDLKYKAHFKEIALSLILIYGLVLIYSTINFLQNGYFGITSVSNVNCFGKVLQYQLEDKGSNIKLINDINNAYASTPKDNLISKYYLEPWNFIGKYGWEKNNYSEIGKYSSSIIKKEFLSYTTKSLLLTLKLMIFTDPFKDFIAINHLSYNELPSKVVKSVYNFFSIIGELYFILILVFLVFLSYIFLLRIDLITKHFNLLIITLLIIYHYLVSAFFSYGDYCRLLAPCYVLLYFLIVNSITAFAGSFSRYLSNKYRL
jgi:hypothetical protein